jgi:hypothetical protein
MEIDLRTEEETIEERRRSKINSNINVNQLFGIIITGILGAIIFLFTSQMDHSRHIAIELGHIKSTVGRIEADAREHFAIIDERHRHEDITRARLDSVEEP